MRRYCIFCGRPINEENKRCPNCGKEIAGRGEVCWKQPKKKLEIKKK